MQWQILTHCWQARTVEDVQAESARNVEKMRQRWLLILISTNTNISLVFPPFSRSQSSLRGSRQDLRGSRQSLRGSRQDLSGSSRFSLQHLTHTHTHTHILVYSDPRWAPRGWEVVWWPDSGLGGWPPPRELHFSSLPETSSHNRPTNPRWRIGSFWCDSRNPPRKDFNQHVKTCSYIVCPLVLQVSQAIAAASFSPFWAQPFVKQCWPIPWEGHPTTI